MPHISGFNYYENRHDPFAVFDYMGVLPTLASLKFFLGICDYARKKKIRLPSKFSKPERRAFIAIKNNQYVTYMYDWQQR